ncbi:MAG: hypothetical protein DRP01_00310 [Archaeoglobales archaeon]|nr:MAG: hypothetical protein DRP01_00310 [Archaeoglobales archaeon]
MIEISEIEVIESDLDDAELFLTEYLTEKVPDGNFSQGGAIRDLAIKAFAYIYAYLRGEADRIALLQSVMRITEELQETSETVTVGDETYDVAQAVDEVMSNWFVTRRGGTYSYVTGLLHFSERTTVRIMKDTKFWKTAALAFYIDSEDDPYVVAESSMLPRFDSKGTLIDYVVGVPLRSALTDTSYDVNAGKFYKVDAPGGLPYFSYAENTEKASGGESIESSADMLDRATTAISVRNLINNRSCDATLMELFPDITSTLTIGMAEPEMIRDRKTEIARHIRLHTGGCYDTYLEMPTIQVEESGPVAGFYPRPDNIVSVFRDPELTYDTATFVALGVKAGHILFIRDGIAGVPRGFQIVLVTDHELYISEAAAFPEASDELLLNEVYYSIGWFYPDFNQLDFDPGPGTLYERTAAPSANPLYAHISAGTSRHISRQGVFVLSGRPVLDIISVEITDPDSADAAIIDPSSGTIRFTNRVNAPPIAASLVGTSQYQLECINHPKAQSGQAVYCLRVGYLTNPSKFDGKNLKVTYQSLRDFNGPANWVERVDVRVSAANHLAKSRHPIWISMTIPYRHKATAGSFLDEADAAETVSSFINDFDANDTLDMSDIMTELRNTYDVLDAVFPFDIYYTLYSADGQILTYRTTDIVSIFSMVSNGVALINSADIVVPAEMQEAGITVISTDDDLSYYYLLMGISDRTVNYRTKVSLITFAMQG